MVLFGICIMHVCMCLYVCVHEEARGKPQMTFLSNSVHLAFETGSLSLSFAQ